MEGLSSYCVTETLATYSRGAQQQYLGEKDQPIAI